MVAIREVQRGLNIFNHFADLVLMTDTATIALTVFAVIGGLFVFIYNSLIFRKNAVTQNSGAVHAYLKKRADLIPNLVAVVERYAEHERDLLSEITKERSRFDLNDTPSNAVQADPLSLLLTQFFVRSEAYPELKSNENYKHLQVALTELEDQLAAARRAYNSAVTYYNDGIQMIPYNLVASAMGLKAKQVDFDVRN